MPQLKNRTDSKPWTVTIAGAGRAIRVPESGYASSFEDLVAIFRAQKMNLGQSVTTEQARAQVEAMICRKDPDACMVSPGDKLARGAVAIGSADPTPVQPQRVVNRRGCGSCGGGMMR